MSDEAGYTAPASPEAVVRVQAISDPKALERHLLRMFDHGQPLYTDYFDLDFAWNLWRDMVADRVDWGSSTSRVTVPTGRASPWR